MRTPLGLKMMLVSVVYKRRQLRIGLYDYIASVASIATIGPTFGHVCLAPKRHTSRAAIATTHVYVRHICKHGH